MKVTATSLTLIATFWGGILTAEQQTPAFDDPGTIWVATELLQPAKDGLTIPLLNYVVFADGQFRDGFAARLRAALPSSCIPFSGLCIDERESGDHYTGAYQVSDGMVVLQDAERSDLTFDIGSADAEIDASTFYRTANGTSPTFADGVMQIPTPTGARTYLPMSEDSLNRVLGVASFPAYSLSLHDFATCFVEGIHRLEQMDAADKTVRNQQVEGFADVGYGVLLLDRRVQQLYSVQALAADSFTEANEDEIKIGSFIRRATGVYLDTVIAKFGENDAALTPDQLAEIDAVFQSELAPALSGLTPGAQELFARNWSLLYDDLTKAAPLFAALRARRTTLDEAVCPPS